jgi:hypothetical protein
MSVVMVSSIGDMWLDEATAKALAHAMKGGSKFVTLKGNLIAVNSIRGLLKPEDYKLMVTTRKQNWVCKYGNGHSPADNCQCHPAVKASEAPQLAEEATLTPAGKAEQERRKQAWLAWLKKYKRNFSNPEFMNNEKREAFIRGYKM